MSKVTAVGKEGKHHRYDRRINVQSQINTNAKIYNSSIYDTDAKSTSLINMIWEWCNLRMQTPSSTVILDSIVLITMAKAENNLHNNLIATNLDMHTHEPITLMTNRFNNNDIMTESNGTRQLRRSIKCIWERILLD